MTSQTHSNKSKVIKVQLDQDNAFLLRNVLTKEQCQELIQMSENAGFKQVPRSGGRQKSWTDLGSEDIRNNFRVCLENERTMKMAEELRKTVDSFIPKDLSFRWNTPHINNLDYLSVESKGSEWKRSCVSERFRFYKYEKNMHFKRHFDGTYRRTVLENVEKEPGSVEMKKFIEQSFLSVLIYLNDDFKGGETQFFDPANKIGQSNIATFNVTPKQGDALLFLHENLHEGRDVKKGTKYLLRTDICYKKEISYVDKHENDVKHGHHKLSNDATNVRKGCHRTCSPWERIYHPSCKNYTD